MSLPTSLSQAAVYPTSNRNRQTAHAVNRERYYQRRARESRLWPLLISILVKNSAGSWQRLGQPVEQAAREMIVLELYRRSLISSGKAAELLGVPRIHFIQRASELGIPYFRFTEEEWQAEVAQSKRT
jgi:predicted HTH domain antitoxin